MKKRSILPVIIIIMVAAIAGVLIYWAFSRQLNILDTQAAQIKNMNIENDAVDMTLYSTGDYMAVEDYMKSYINEYCEKLQEFESLTNDSSLSSMLGISNVSSDGPEFEVSKAYIEEKNSEIETLYEELVTMATEENILSYIDESSVGDMIKRLYEREMIDVIGLDFYETEEELAQTRDEMLERVSNIGAVVNFLSENSENWSIDNNLIKFTEDQYLEEYNQLIDAVRG